MCFDSYKNLKIEKVGESKFKNLEIKSSITFGIFRSNESIIKKSLIKKNDILKINSEISLIFKDNNRSEIESIIAKYFNDICSNYKNCNLDNYYFFRDLVIGEGNYGMVHFGIELYDKIPLAIKRFKKGMMDDSYKKESEIIKKLNNKNIYPKIYGIKFDPPYTFIMNSLHGPNLAKLKYFCYGRNFKITTIYKICSELISCLEFFHEIGYLHYDLKEDNIIMLLEPMIYKNISFNFILIDFGLSIKIFDENNKYICKTEESKKYGNYYYASLNALKGKKVGKKDDLINLIYIILNWIKPVPWNNFDYKKPSYKLDIINSKENFNIKKEYSNFRELVYIFEDVNKIKEDETPRYNEYKQKLELYIENKKIYEDKDIKNLFLGYPKILIEKFCEKYMK